MNYNGHFTFLSMAKVEEKKTPKQRTICPTVVIFVSVAVKNIKLLFTTVKSYKQYDVLKSADLGVILHNSKTIQLKTLKTFDGGRRLYASTIICS